MFYSKHSLALAPLDELALGEVDERVEQGDDDAHHDDARHHVHVVGEVRIVDDEVAHAAFCAQHL